MDRDTVIYQIETTIKEIIGACKTGKGVEMTLYVDRRGRLHLYRNGAILISTDYPDGLLAYMMGYKQSLYDNMRMFQQR